MRDTPSEPCVSLTMCRTLSLSQQEALQALSRQVIAQMELRHQIVERDKAQRHLRASEARKAAILQSALDCIITIDQQGCVVEWNPAAEWTFGYVADEAVGQELAALIVPPALRDAHRQGLTRFLATGEGSVLGKRIEILAMRVGGEEFPIELAITPVTVEGEVLFTACLRDITERKQAEQALSDQDKKYRLLFENATHGIYRTTPDGRILLANPALLQMLGYDSVEQLTTRNLEADGTEAAYTRAEFKARLEAEGELRGLEAVWARRDGQLICVRENARLVLGLDGTPLFYEGSVEDITARKEAEEALRRAHEELEARVKARTADLSDANAALQAEMAQRQRAEDNYRSLFENAVEGIFQSSPGGHYLSANPALAHLYGYDSSEEMICGLADIGAQLYVQPGRRDEFARLMEESDVIAGFESEVYRRDGTTLWISEAARIIRSPTGALLRYEGTVQDITERKRAEEQIRATGDMLQIIMDNIPQFVFWKDTQSVYQGCNRNFAQAAGFTHPNDIRGKTDYELPWTPEEAHHYQTVDRRVMDANTSELRFMETQHQADGRLTWLETNKIPLHDAQGQVVGILGTFQDYTERKEAEEQIRALNADLMQAYDATIEGWSRALDLRDHETEGHCRRVTELTLRLAAAIGMTSEELVHVRRGALLHDIGKMGVPDNVLLKPGPLSDEEWAIMRRHPELACEMLRPIDFLYAALEIPGGHHEKWDGTGYPQGLSGEAIPLSARLFAAIDIWDALRSDRPYRKAWPAERVLDHICGLSGTHFDPQVVRVFMAMMKQEQKAEVIRIDAPAERLLLAA